MLSLQDLLGQVGEAAESNNTAQNQPYQQQQHTEKFENMIRLAILAMVDQTDLFQVEAAFTAANACGRLFEAYRNSSTSSRSLRWLCSADLYHNMLRDVQRAVELRFRLRHPRHAWGAVYCLELSKLLLVLWANRRKIVL
eukprot:PhM_4_TR10514/c0_g1_i2/m.15424